MPRKGVGAYLTPIQRHAFTYYAFTERRSLREAARLACIAKGTGQGLYWDIRSERARDARKVAA